MECWNVGMMGLPDDGALENAHVDQFPFNYLENPVTGVVSCTSQRITHDPSLT